MALGGGTFVTQNKILPGSYINFVSAIKSNSSLSNRGIAAIPLPWSWGADGKVFTVTNEDFIKDCRKIFGYDYSSDTVKPLRDLYKGAKKVFFYKLNTGAKASNTICTAKYKGTRGNSIKTAVVVNVEDVTKFDVETYLDLVLVDTQTVTSAASLVDNDYVDFNKSATLAADAGTNLSGGTDVAPIGSDYSTALAAFESYSFNALGCISSDSTIKALVTAYTKRLRDDVGVKFQCVLHKYTTADHEGIVSVENNTNPDLVYWALGKIAGCEVNASLTNRIYDGEYTVDTNYTQAQLEAAITAGKFIFHSVNDEVRVLEDINTLTTTTADKGEDFKSNQTIRVIDQIGNDIAAMFNDKYLGNVPNDDAGRTALWNDIVTHHNSLQQIRAIEDFSSEDITVAQGNTKKSVVVTDSITPTNCMSQLYMTVVVN